jgi:DNA-binding NarL/FixJ family response regulator
MGDHSKMEKNNRRPVHRVMVVDDHPVVRKGLAQLLGTDASLHVCGEASGIREAMDQLNTVKPDLIVLDLALKDGNGLELIKRLRSECPNVRVLVASMQEDWLFAERAIHAGALGYINKREAPELILEATRTVMSGKVFLNEEMTERLLARAINPRESENCSGIELLTDRELEVFTLLGEGQSTRKIAAALHISIKTVETHRENIKRKLNLHGTNELVQRAVEWTMSQKLNLS